MEDFVVMGYILAVLAVLAMPLMGDYRATVSAMTPQLQKRLIQGDSWREGCPVAIENLRYLQVSYRDFDGKEREGELVVHHEVAEDVTKIFEALYKRGYPIRQMRLVSDFKSSDFASIEADNTSAFNCRNATGSNRWSRHSYGKAIDINPIENPYIFNSGRISHKASLPYRARIKEGDLAVGQKAMILDNDAVVQLFRSYGWRWGGDFAEKDYQHFDKP